MEVGRSKKEQVASPEIQNSNQQALQEAHEDSFETTSSQEGIESSFQTLLPVLLVGMTTQATSQRKPCEGPRNQEALLFSSFHKRCARDGH